MYKFRKEGVMNLLVAILSIFLILTSTIASNVIKEGEQSKTQVQILEIKLQEKQEALDIINENIKVLQQEQEVLKRMEQERQELEQKRTRSVSNLQSRGGFSRYSDISANRDLTVEDMNQIIDFWDNHVKGGTRFKGHGESFIAASKASGLNPIIILSHAASESQWGNSYIAREKNNFFGINCVDSDPGKGYVMGDDVRSGIINGSLWIKKNFYINGYTSLQSMLDANYASDSEWARTILSIANASVRVLQS